MVTPVSCCFRRPHSATLGWANVGGLKLKNPVGTGLAKIRGHTKFNIQRSRVRRHDPSVLLHDTVEAVEGESGAEVS